MPAFAGLIPAGRDFFLSAYLPYLPVGRPTGRKVILKMLGGKPLF